MTHAALPAGGRTVAAILGLLALLLAAPAARAELFPDARPGTVLDEARRAGRPAASFPHADEDSL